MLEYITEEGLARNNGSSRNVNETNPVTPEAEVRKFSRNCEATAEIFTISILYVINRGWRDLMLFRGISSGRFS